MMNLNFNINIAAKYTSKSQIARILTEKWMEENAYCLSCGYAHLSVFENNRPYQACVSFDVMTLYYKK